MKPFSVHSGSCSCTSCVYRSRSKDPKVQQIIQGRTEIDKLYYGKYLPLRERKLLEKCLRTRNVYDDMRNQLLSSASSDQTSLESKRKRRDYVSTDKRSAVLKIVDLGDRKQMGSPNTSKFSSCCSFCSGETLTKIRKRIEKNKHPRIHRHIVTCEDDVKNCVETEKRGKKRRKKLSKKISSKIRAARPNMIKNLSEPSACTLSLSSMTTRSLKAFKRMRSKKKATESAQARKVVKRDQETKIPKLPRKLRKKVKKIQSSTTQDSGTELRSMKAFNVNKKSTLLFKENFLKKRSNEHNQDVEWEPGTCDECIPEECLKKIKTKGVGDTKKIKYDILHSETGTERFQISKSSRTKKVKVNDPQVQDGPNSKSFQSITTISRTKVTPWFLKSHSKRNKSHEVTSPLTRHKRGRQKPRHESYQNVEEADLEKPIEHVKAKRETCMIPTHGRIKQRRKHKHRNTKFTGNLSKASQESYLRESAGQANDLPFPREWELILCKLYECYPEICAQILRSKSRGKSAMTSIDLLRRKSVGSAAFSQKFTQKTSSRSRTKSKHKQSKSAESFIRKPKYVSKEPPPVTNRRTAKHVFKDTNTTVISKKCVLPSVSQSISKSTSRTRHCDCVNNEEFDCKVSGDKSQRHENKNIKHKGRHSTSSNVESKISGDLTKIQAVQIGSNFNKRRHLQEKEIRVNEPYVGYETSKTNKYVKTYAKLILQRCLSTLQLLKKNKNKVETLSPWQKRNEYVMHMQKKAVTTNGAEIRYNPERSKLLPYLWDPGLCIPKECHPYNSESIIKLRHMILQHKHSNIFSGDVGSRSTFSKISKTVTPKSRNNQFFTKERPQNPLKVKKRNQNYNEINIMPSRSKQRVMRVGSKPSLKMSHYKSKGYFITTEDLINKHTHNKNKLNTMGSQQLKRSAHHTSIDAKAKRIEKGRYVFSAIKRCFSPLKFENTRNKKGQETKINIIGESIKTSYPLPNSQICAYKINRTGLSKLPYGLSSCNCTPNVCMPGMSDPYERYEESKWREITGLHDTYVSRDRREIKSVTSVTTCDFSGKKMAKGTTSRLKHKTKKQQKERYKQRDIKVARSFSRSRQAARKGSNFSLNKEISKYRFVPSIRDTTIKNRVAMNNTFSEISTVSRMPNKGTKNKQYALKDDFSQVNEIRKEVKVSNVGFILKKCFCTLGLQKKNKWKSEFHWNQPITTQFVQVEQNIHDITKSGCKVLNKTLYGGEPLKFKLPEGDHLLRENLIGNQSDKHLPNSRSFLRPAPVRSRIEFYFDKMRCLRQIQKINPFSRSFYALHLKVSNTKNIPHNKYRALHDNERRPSGCPPNECDPVDCSNKVKQLLIRSKLPERHKSLPKSDITKKDSRKKGTNKPNTLGSDFSIKAGVYKDTDPYKSPRSKAIRLGSDVRVNFEFFKARPSCRFSRTGSITHHDRKKTRRSYPRPADLQAYGETQSKVTGISYLMRRCFCTSKLENATESDINQNRDVTRKVKDKPTYRSTTRLSHRREKRERSLKTKSVQYKDYSQQQRRNFRRPTERHNVTFCTNENCVEERGEGDVGNQKDTIAEKKTVIDKCLCALKPSKKPKSEKNDKKNKPNNFMEKCYCTLNLLKGQNKGKLLTPCRKLDDAEREMETIMPYSKTKFKKFDSQQNQEGVCIYCKQQCPPSKPDSKMKNNKLDGQLKLAQATKQNTEQNQEGVCNICKTQCQPIKTEPKPKNKKVDGQLKLAQGKNNKNTTQNQEGVCNICKTQCQPIKTEAKPKNKKVDGQLKLAQGTNNKNTTQKQELVCDFCKQPCQPDLNKRPIEKPKEEPKEKPKEKPKKEPKEKPKEKPKKEPKEKAINLDDLKNLCPVCRAVATGKIKKLNKKMVCTCDRHLGRKKVAPGLGTSPLFSMMVDQSNMRIVNKDEVIRNLSPSGKAAKAMKRARAAQQPEFHERDCKCCLCRKARRAAFSAKPRKLRPCICGSRVCKKEWKELKSEHRSREIRRSMKLKKCVCGTAICDDESEKMPELLLDAAKQADRDKERVKRAYKKEKQYQKARKRRIKESKKDFKRLKKKRLKEDAIKMKGIKKTKEATDMGMIAESLIDLGTFGSNAFCDIARYVCKSIRHPRDAKSDIRHAYNEPEDAARSIMRTAEGMGLFGTLARIGQRIMKMPSGKKGVAKLEKYPTTNYLLHLADHDPKKRMKKFPKVKHKREPLDFQCSLYMASMRKRPCLKVYYMCPWFYPHFMSLVNVWKQFTDILLFLLAVLVWSPCILCMELCRGLVCCGLCQG